MRKWQGFLIIIIGQWLMEKYHMRSINHFSAEEFDKKSSSVLNSTEKKNVEFLEKAEKALEPGGYELDQQAPG